MKERMVTVKLGGYLKQFGREHKFMVSKPREVIKALCKQIKGFENAMNTANLRGFRFAVFNGKHNIKDVEELELGTKDVMRIIPIMEGSKRAGLFQTILGAAIVAVGVFSSAYGGAGVIMAGVSMMAGGAVQMLAPQAQGLKTKSDADNQASYAFGSPVNTTAQGNPIGLLYGEREVGGAIVSAEILAEDQA